LESKVVSEVEVDIKLYVYTTVLLALPDLRIIEATFLSLTMSLSPPFPLYNFPERKAAYIRSMEQKE